MNAQYVDEHSVPQREMSDGSHDLCPNCLSVFCSGCWFCCIPCLLCPCSPCFNTVETNESLVTLYWGKLFREIQKPGIHFLNPYGLTKFKVSLKQESIDLKNVRVVDGSGSPIIVSAVIRYRVVNAIRASLEIMDYKKYVENSSYSVLKQICAKYPFFSSVGGKSLRSEGKEIQEEMVKLLQVIGDDCGILILAVDMNEMSYSPEIAEAMLIRQQAEAKLEAEEAIVSGCVDIIKKSMNGLDKAGVKLANNDKSKTISNLLTVLVSDEKVEIGIETY